MGTVNASGESGPAVSREVWRVIVLLMVGTTLVTLDTTIVNVAIEPLAEELGADLGVAHWIVTGYILSIAVVIPATGFLARRFSPRYVYLSALLAFTIGSALCASATSVEQLIAFRVMQGLGGGAIPPIAQMIIVGVSEPRNLHHTMSRFGVPTVLAPVFGPVIGGAILSSVSWRWIFIINIPIGLIGLFVARSRLPEGELDRSETFDLSGLVMAATGLAALIYGLSQTREASTTMGWGGPVGLGVLLLAGFVLRSVRTAQPLLDMHLYRNRNFVGAAVASFFLGGALVVNSVLVPLYLQLARGLEPFGAGLLTAPRGVGATIGTWFSGRCMERFGPGVTAIIGSTGLLAFTVPFVLLDEVTPYWFIIGIGVLQGIAIGLSIMPAMTSGYRALRPEQIQDATPQLAILSRVGSSVGVAVLFSILEANLARAVGIHEQARAFGVTFGWLTVVTLPAVAAAIVLAKLERGLDDVDGAPDAADDPVVAPGELAVDTG